MTSPGGPEVGRAHVDIGADFDERMARRFQDRFNTFLNTQQRNADNNRPRIGVEPDVRSFRTAERAMNQLRTATNNMITSQRKLVDTERSNADRLQRAYAQQAQARRAAATAADSFARAERNLAAARERLSSGRGSPNAMRAAEDNLLRTRRGLASANERLASSERGLQATYERNASNIQRVRRDHEELSRIYNRQVGEVNRLREAMSHLGRDNNSSRNFGRTLLGAFRDVRRGFRSVGRVATEVADVMGRLPRVFGFVAAPLALLGRSLPAIAVSLGLVGFAVKTLTSVIGVLIPVIGQFAMALGGLVAFAPALVGAFGAVGGVLMAAFSGIGDAMKASDKLAKESVNSNKALADAQKGVAQASRSIEDAQRSLADAHRNVADTAEQGARRIEDAERNVADAHQNVADTAEDGARRIQDAQEKAADATAEVGRTAQDSARRVQSAEKDLATAQRSSREAQLSLNDAREDARKTLRDLNMELKGAALDEEDATLSVLEARQRLAEVTADMAKGDATGLDRARAELAVRQALQRQAEVQEKNNKLREDAAEANTKGIEGDEAVVRAKQAVIDTQEAEAQSAENLAQTRQDAAAANAEAVRNDQKAQQDLARTHRDVARANQDAARQEGDAIRNLADTRQEVARANEDAQRRVADAERNVADAQQALIDAQQRVNEALNQSSAAMDEYNRAMANLGPNAQQFVHSLNAVKETLGGLRMAIQESALADLGPRLEEAASTASSRLQPALVGLADNMNTGFKNAISQLTDDETLGKFSVIIDNVSAAISPFIAGMSNLIDMFASMAEIGSGFLPGLAEDFNKITGGWKEWIESDEGKEAFKNFLIEAGKSLRLVLQLLGEIGKLFGNIFMGGASNEVGKSSLETMVETLRGWNEYLGSPEGQEAMKKWFEDAKEFMGDFADAVTAVVDAINDLKKAADFVGLLINPMEKLKDKLPSNKKEDGTPLLTGSAEGGLDSNNDGLRAIGAPAILPDFTAAKEAWEGFKTWMGTLPGWFQENVWAPMASGWGWVTQAWNNSKNWVSEQFAGFTAWLGSLPGWLQDNVWGAMVSGWNWVTQQWNNARNWVVERFQSMGTWFGTFRDWMYTNIWQKFVDAWNWVTQQWNNARNWIIERFQSFGNWLGTLRDWLYTNVWQRFVDAWNWVVEQWNNGRNWIIERFQSFGNWLGTLRDWLQTNIWDRFVGAWRWVCEQFEVGKNWIVNNVFNPLKNAFGEVLSFFEGIGRGIEAVWRNVANTGIDAINWMGENVWNKGIIGTIEKVVNAIPGVNVEIPARFTPLQKFASGGFVRGPGGPKDDKIPAMLSNGEYVLPADIVKKVGIRNLDQFIGLKQPKGGRANLGPEGMFVPRYYAGGAIVDERIKAAHDFMRQEQGKPYQWAGVGNPSWDCCLIPGTMVYGPDGACPIEELRPGSRVYSYVDGQRVVSTVKAQWFSKRQQTWRVKFRNQAIVGSGNHPFLRLSPQGPRRAGKRIDFGVEWARLDELQPGDLIVAPKSVETDSKPDPMLCGQPVTRETAWLAGLFVGDGYTTQRDTRICVYGDTRKRAKSAMRELGASHLMESDKHGLIGYGLLLDELNPNRDRAHEKRVPEQVWQWPHDLQRSFLDGYCDADGHYPKNPSKHGERTYGSASPLLAAEIRALHITLGDQVSNLTVTERSKPIFINGVEVREARPLHRFSVWSGKRAGLGEVGKLRSLQDWVAQGDFTVRVVQDVSDAGVQDTYDIEVSDSHNFVAESVIVHNSGLWSGIVHVLTGKNARSGRLFTTHSFAGSGPPGWTPGLTGPVTIGTDVGTHMSGTLAGIAAESAGSGKGVVFGGSAWGSENPYYNTHFTFGDFLGEYTAAAEGSGGGASFFNRFLAMLNPFDNLFDGFDAKYGIYKDMIQGVIGGVAKSIKDHIISLIPFVGGGGSGEYIDGPVGEAVERWRPLVEQALAYVGLPVTDRNVNATLGQIHDESGGDNNIAQQITDINGTGENAGVGLLQIIPTTWAAHRDPALPDNRRDPFANLVGCMRYYRSKYGDDLTLRWGRGKGGYQTGGMIPGAGTGDIIPAMLEPGEYVMNRHAVKALGPLLHQWNTKDFPRFQTGGLVGGAMDALGMSPANPANPIPVFVVNAADIGISTAAQETTEAAVTAGVAEGMATPTTSETLTGAVQEGMENASGSLLPDNWADPVKNAVKDSLGNVLGDIGRAIWDKDKAERDVEQSRLELEMAKGTEQEKEAQEKLDENLRILTETRDLMQRTLTSREKVQQLGFERVERGLKDVMARLGGDVLTPVMQDAVTQGVGVVQDWLNAGFNEVVRAAEGTTRAVNNLGGAGGEGTPAFGMPGSSWDAAASISDAIVSVANTAGDALMQVGQDVAKAALQQKPSRVDEDRVRGNLGDPGMSGGMLADLIVNLTGVEIQIYETLIDTLEQVEGFRKDLFQDGPLDEAGRLLSDTAVLFQRSETSFQRAIKEQERINKALIKAMLKYLMLSVVLPILTAVISVMIQVVVTAIGAAIGSLIPGIGTAVGAAIGAVVGAALAGVGAVLISGMGVMAAAGIDSFDSGGFAVGKGLMVKDTNAPEMVIPPSGVGEVAKAIQTMREFNNSSSAKVEVHSPINMYGVRERDGENVRSHLQKLMVR